MDGSPVTVVLREKGFIEASVEPLLEQPVEPIMAAPMMTADKSRRRCCVEVFTVDVPRLLVLGLAALCNWIVQCCEETSVLRRIRVPPVIPIGCLIAVNPQRALNALNKNEKSEFHNRTRLVDITWTLPSDITNAYSATPALPVTLVLGSRGAGNSCNQVRLICVAQAPDAVAGSTSVTHTPGI